MIILILYLIGVPINCYLVYRELSKEYNAGRVITVGNLFRGLIACLFSWALIAIILGVYVCHGLFTFFNIPLIKKK